MESIESASGGLMCHLFSSEMTFKLLPFNVPSAFDIAFGVGTFSLFIPSWYRFLVRCSRVFCYSGGQGACVTNDDPFALILLARLSLIVEKFAAFIQDL